MDKPFEKKKKRKVKSKIYFGQPVQDAIVEYQNAGTDEEKNVIYAEKIHYAFDKLVENIIYTYKFYYFDYDPESVKNETVSFLVMNMHKYNNTKGKAFSYFGTVAKNYLILHNNNNFKKYKIHDEVNKLDLTRDIGNESYEIQKAETAEDFISQMINYWEDSYMFYFKKKSDIIIADSIIELFRRCDDIENFNKKSLYILVREMTGMNTQHITRVLGVMKKVYNEIYWEFEKTGKIETAGPFF